jgi:protein-disulfide isomerase
VSTARAFLVATLTAVAVGVALVSASAATSSKHVAAAPAATAETGGLAAVSATRELLAGIPQRSTVLGRPGAPVTLVEFADLQCPYCGLWARGTLPTLVQRYVRTGKLRIDFRGLAFVGPDSETALRVAHAAGLQNRLWNVVELLYENQGTENTGWVTGPLLRSVVLASGADVARVFARTDAPSIDAQLGRARAEATRFGIPGTPYFAIGRTGSAPRPLEVSSLDPGEFEQAIQGLLR